MSDIKQAIVLSLMVITCDSARLRRASLLRQSHGQLIPKTITTFSPIRDNVVTMIALKMKANGNTKSQIREALISIFTHGCYCGWNYGRHELSDKTLQPKDKLDQVCLDFEHCSECVTMDGCQLQNEDFMPLINGTEFSCQHLNANSCQYNMCLCSSKMADNLVDGLIGFNFSILSFSNFVSECTGEVDAAINTQMNLGMNIFGAQRGLAITKSRQCCGQYPNRKAFTYSGADGMSCCNNKWVYDQRHKHCCSSGTVRIGDVCW